MRKIDEPTEKGRERSKSCVKEQMKTKITKRNERK